MPFPGMIHSNEDSHFQHEIASLIELDEHYFQTENGKKRTLRFLHENCAHSIPKAYRWVLWEKFVQLHKKSKELPPNCYELFVKKTYRNGALGIEEGGETIYVHENIAQILMDVPRSKLGVGPEDVHDRNMSEEDLIQQRTKLFNILYALSMYFPTIGYCQGMSYICTLLQSVMTESEENVFLLMVCLMDTYELRGLFTPSFPQLKKVEFVFEHIMQKRHGKLWRHMSKLGTSSNLFLPKWILSMFCLDFPYEFVVQVWDCFLLVGWKAIYQVCCSLLVQHQERIFACNKMETLLFILQDIPSSMSDLNAKCNVFERCDRMFKDKDLKQALIHYNNKISSNNK